MEKRKCISCGIEKELSDFYKAKVNKTGYTGKCKSCICEHAKKYREKNRGPILSTSRSRTGWIGRENRTGVLGNGKDVIFLTKGKETKVSPEDYDYLMQWRWFYNGRIAQRTTKCNRKQNTIKMHRMIINAPRGKEVDHINGDPLDNRRENLRLATHAENGMNKPAQSNNTSGYKGVTWHKQRQKWAAQISIDGKHVSLGLFPDPIEAYEAYCEAAKKAFGLFFHG